MRNKPHELVYPFFDCVRGKIRYQFDRVLRHHLNVLSGRLVALYIEFSVEIGGNYNGPLVLSHIHHKQSLKQ